MTGADCSFLVNDTEDLRKHGSPLPFFGDCKTLPKRVFDCVKSLNQLAGIKFNNAQEQPPCRPPTKVQSDVVNHVQMCLDELGGCPKNLDGQNALTDLTRSFCPYDGMPSHLANYDFSKIKILHSGVKPKKVLPLLPEHVKPFLQDVRHHIVRDPMQVQAELAEKPDAMPRRPYWDPILQRDVGERMKLFRRMHEIGLLDLQPTVLAKAGIFCVKKKTPQFIRMIIDGRQANFMHRRPPVTRLGSSACLAELRIPTADNDNDQPTARECDVSDCFYQFRIDEIGAFFAVGEGKSRSWWHGHGISVDSVYDYNLGARRGTFDHEILYPVISGMSMGWAWALYFANEIVAGIVRESAPHPRAELREKMPCPQLSEYSSITSTYVDNVTVIGRNASVVDERCRMIDKAFKDLGIPVVWSQDSPVECIETVGCVLDLKNKTLRNKSNRVWRTYLAGLELCRRSRVRVQHVEIWLGHVTSLFRLRPCLLSIFNKIYRFCLLDVPARIPLRPSARREIRQACQLIWLARVDLGCSMVSQVDAGDSADFGYALMCCPAADWEISRALRFREKWRFVPYPEEIKEALTKSDRQQLLELLERKAGVPLIACDLTGKSLAFSQVGLGIDTQYGQWLQQSLAEGNWKKTSTIASQLRAKKRSRADVDLPALVEPISMSLLKPERYKLLWAKRWRDPSQHINIKEAMVALSSLKRTARVSSLAGTLKLTLSDNLAVVLAFEKGRSGSPALNRLCRHAAALQLGLGILWRLRHIESPRNVSDAPSRWFEPHRKQEQRWIQFPKAKASGSAELQLAKLLCPEATHSHIRYRQDFSAQPQIGLLRRTVQIQLRQDSMPLLRRKMILVSHLTGAL